MRDTARESVDELSVKPCPRCGAPAHRSRSRTLLDLLLRWMLWLKAWRCSACEHRFRRFR